MRAFADVDADPLAAWRVAREPSYQPRGDEVAMFEAAHAQRLPMMLKGPTGCGKTRFVEYMAWRLRRPLVTLACHEALGAADLVGRWRPDGAATRWQDGPLAIAARAGALFHLDGPVAARPDAMALVHALTDTRRVLTIAARGELLHAHPDFQLVVSCGPSSQAVGMTPATRQRFCAMRLAYPDAEQEATIVARESGLDLDRAATLVAFGLRTRRLQGAGLDEGASTRLLVHAARLVAQGLAPARACRLALVEPLGDDADVRDALEFALDASF